MIPSFDSGTSDSAHGTPSSLSRLVHLEEPDFIMRPLVHIMFFKYAAIKTILTSGSDTLHSVRQWLFWLNSDTYSASTVQFFRLLPQPARDQ